MRRETCNDFRIYRLLKSFFEEKNPEKNVEKCHFSIYRPLRTVPYSTRPGTGKTCSLHVTPPVEITPKTAAKFASLNSSISFGDLKLGGCLRRPPSQAPARAQSLTRNTRIKRRKFRGSFVGYFDVPESEVYTVLYCIPEFTVRAQ